MVGAIGNVARRTKPGRPMPARLAAQLLSGGHGFLGSFASGLGGVASSSSGIAGSGSSVAGSSGSSIARFGGGGSSGIAGSGSSITSGFASSLRSLTGSSGSVLSLFLLRASSQRQGQRESSENHLGVHVIYHPSDIALM